MGHIVRALGNATPLVVAFALCGGLTAAFGAAGSARAMSAIWGACGFCAAVVNPLPGVASVGASYTLVKMARYCLMFWLPYFFNRHVHLPPATSALVAAIFDVAGVFGSVSAGVACDKLFGGRMIGTTLPFTLATSATFLGWAALCAWEAGGPPLFGGALHVLAMAIVGFFIAAPDGILGGAAARNLCDYDGAASDAALAAAASGLVNGCGSVGAILQGGLTAKLVDAVGWSGLFATLSLAMAATAVAVRGACAVEAEAMGA